jgi:hypothetical protein
MHNHWDAHCGLSLVHFLSFPKCQGGDGPILEIVSRAAEDPFCSRVEVTQINEPSLSQAGEGSAAILDKSKCTWLEVWPVVRAAESSFATGERKESEKTYAK